MRGSINIRLNIYFDFFYILICNIFHSAVKSARYFLIKVYRSCINYPLFLSDFNTTREFLCKFPKNPQTSFFIKKKIRPVCPELYLADGQNDVTKLIEAFGDYANASIFVTFCLCA